VKCYRFSKLMLSNLWMFRCGSGLDLFDDQFDSESGAIN
jgi:hypothetical protein